MLPSLSIQIFNTVVNGIEASLLIYIAVQAYLNNQAIREKQVSANTRLDHIFEALQPKPKAKSLERKFNHGT